MSYVTENPATGTVEKTFETMTDADVEDVLARTAAAYSQWRQTPVDERVRMLRDTAHGGALTGPQRRER